MHFHHLQGTQLDDTGVWSADWGTITATGQYTAPAFLPPYGTDTVTYTTPQGISERVNVRVVPSAGLPESGQSPVKRVSWLSTDQYRPEVFLTGGDELPGIHDPLDPAQKVLAIGYDETLPALDGYLPHGQAPAYQISSSAYRRVPTVGSTLLTESPILMEETGSPVAVVALLPNPSQAVVESRTTPITEETPCPSGCVEGEVEPQEQQPSAPTITGPVPIGLGSVSKSDQGNINGKIGDVLGAAYTVTITAVINLVDQQTFYDYTQKRHKYQCQNKQWKYIGTEARKRRDIHHKYSPWWAWIVDWVPGRPKGGLKGTYVEKGTWSDWGGA